MPKTVKKSPAIKSGRKAAVQSAPKKTKAVRISASSLNTPVFGLEGKKKGTLLLPKEIFAAKINKPLMAQAVRVYLVNQRQGTASTKTRSEVRGSTRKIYRQKGTGRARHGAITAPIFVGGGVALGPRPRNFELKLSKQMKKKSLFSALSLKFQENKVFVVDTSAASGKTKQMINLLKSLNLAKKNAAENILFVGGNNVIRSVRNIRNLEVKPANVINTYNVLRNNYLVLSKDSIVNLESNFLGKPDNTESKPRNK